MSALFDLSSSDLKPLSKVEAKSGRCAALLFYASNARSTEEPPNASFGIGGRLMGVPTTNVRVDSIPQTCVLFPQQIHSQTELSDGLSFLFIFLHQKFLLNSILFFESLHLFLQLCHFISFRARASSSILSISSLSFNATPIQTESSSVPFSFSTWTSSGSGSSTSDRSDSSRSKANKRWAL
nr:hypothetical protein Iba_chr05fCG0430 [Ipomoea batatas]